MNTMKKAHVQCGEHRKIFICLGCPEDVHGIMIHIYHQIVVADTNQRVLLVTDLVLLKPLTLKTLIGPLFI